jgi:hypothetical protein
MTRSSVFVVIISIIISSSSAQALSSKKVIAKCLNSFGSHPFDKKNPKFRVIEPTVKVFGFGKNIIDRGRTDKVELVLIKNPISVLSKTTYQLENPNGWYCMHGKVAVLAKTIINLDCAAKFTTSNGTVRILAKDRTEDRGGVIVLGKTEIKRVNCKKAPTSASN